MYFFERSAKYTLLAFGFLIPISTVAVNIAVGLLLLLFLLSGNYQQKWIAISCNPIVLLSLALFALLGIATLYSTASFQEATTIWMKYRKLLCVALVVPFLQDAKWRRWALAAFLAAMLVTLLLSYGYTIRAWIFKVPFDNNAVVFKSHIAQNFLMAFTAYLLLQISLQTTRPLWRWLAALAALLAFCNVLLFVQGRIGYIVLPALLILAAWQRFGLRGLLAGASLSIVLLALVFSLSSTFQQRILQIKQVAVDAAGHRIDSTGQRLDFYKRTLRLIQKNPIFGQGTGSLEANYRELTIAQTGSAGIKTPNPHNEYMMLTVQTGLIGLFLFLFLLFQLWKQSYSLPLFERHLAQGIVVAFAIGCTLNSFLLDFTEGYWFVYLTALLYAPIRFTTNKSL